MIGQISSSREKLIKLLCEKLKTRFEDTVEKILSATSVANFKQWPLNEKSTGGLWRYYDQGSN